MITCKIKATETCFRRGFIAKKILSVFIFFIVILSSYGQTKPKDSIRIIEINEVILKSTIKKAVTGITASSIISSEVFETFTPLEITSSINQIPGVYALSGALNTNRITIRGIGARTPFGTDKLRLYFNGIPVTNGSGSSTIEAFDLENLGSIEVLKGPKGTSYGSNLGGAILLKAKNPEYDSTSASNNFTFGSYGLVKNNTNFQHTKGKFHIGISYNLTEIDGYRENSRFQRNGMLLRSHYQIHQSHTLGLLVNHIDYVAQIPSSINQTDFDENPRLAAANWLAAKGFEDNLYTLVGLHYTGKFSEKFQNTSSVFYSSLDHYEPRPFNILSDITKSYGFRTQFTGTLSLWNSDLEFSFGGELYKDEYDWATYKNDFRDNNDNGSLQGDQISHNKEYRNQLNLFSSMVLSLTKKLKAQFNLGMNYTDYDFRDLFNSGEANKSASRSFDPIVLPSVSLDFSPTTSYNFYANVSKGFSNPNLEETLTPDGIINPDIEQEKGISYEIGSRMRLLDRRLLFHFSLYRMDIEDLLVAQRVGEDQYIGKNAGKTKHQGVELDLSYEIPIAASSSIKPFVRYSLSDHSFVDFVDEGEDFSGNPLTGVPKNKLDAGLYFRLGGFYWNATYLFVDEIPLTDGNTLNSEPFSVFNTKIGYEKNIKEKLTLGFHVGINNVLDTKYAQSVLINAVGFGGSEPRYFYPGNNRNYYASLKLAYRL